MDQLDETGSALSSSCATLDKHLSNNLSTPSAVSSFSIMPTSSYLPDLLPIQEHDLLQQTTINQEVFTLPSHQDILSNAAGHQLGHHPMLEGLQPIRKGRWPLEASLWENIISRNLDKILACSKFFFVSFPILMKLGQIVVHMNATIWPSFIKIGKETRPKFCGILS